MMIDYSAKNLRLFSMMGQRGTFGKVLLDMAQENQQIFAMTADQSSALGLNRFKDVFPDRYLNMGISEQNAIGVAAGLANEGYTPFLAFQAAFASMRCADQVRVNMSYMGLGVKLVGIFSGLTLGDFGPTHYAMQDNALMRSMPNIMVL